jgi:uncharacterized protein DUF3106
MKTRITVALMVSLLWLAAPSRLIAANDNWRNLTPTEKDKVRENYQRWQRLPPQDKDHLRDEWNRWQRLPKDERDRIKQRYDRQRRDRRED